MKIKLFGGPFDGEEHEAPSSFSDMPEEMYRPKDYAGLVSDSKNVGSYSIYKKLKDTADSTYFFVKSVEVINDSDSKTENSNIKLTQEELDLVIKMATYCFYKDIASKARLSFSPEYSMQVLLNFGPYMDIMKKFERDKDQQLSFNNLLQQVEERLNEYIKEPKESI